TRTARWLRPILGRHGIGVAPLQDPRVGALLGMSRRGLLTELRFLMSDGTHSGGANAVLAVARRILWARPLVWLSRLPGAMPLFDAGYKWIAARRNCGAAQCSLNEQSHKAWRSQP